MKNKKRFYSLFITVLCAAFLWLLISPDILEARGGRSFGGSRSFGGGSRSFGGSKSFGGSRSAPAPSYSRQKTPSTSFGGNRSTTPGMSNTRSGISSFGGNRMSSPTEYTSKYGVPRKSVTSSQMSGIPQNYVVHQYDGFGSGLMMGYMMGHSSWMWGMPFHPAFYYSQPYYVQNASGGYDVYPPVFSWSKLFFTILVFLAIVYIIYAIVRSYRRRRGSGGYSQSSFS